MRLGITSKLFAAILVTNLIVVVAFGTAVQISVDRGFREYVQNRELRRLHDLARGFEAAYVEHGNWTFIRDDPDQWRRLARNDHPPGRRGGPRSDAPPGERFNDAPHERGDGPHRHGDGRDRHGDGADQRTESPDKQRERPPLRDQPPSSPFPPPKSDVERGPPPLTLLDASEQYLQGDAMPAGKLALSVPLTVQGATVGWLGVPRLPFGGYDSQYVEHQLRSSWIIGGFALLIAGIVSILLARNFLAPIRRLVGATHRLASGDYSQRVTTTTRDELGQLVVDFNGLAATLQQADTNRRTFLADVSHELRTPLAVLRAELEALQDGVRSLTPDAVRSLQVEVATLTALVNDLYDLALADSGEASYEKTPVDIAELVRVALRGFEPRFAQRHIAIDASGISSEPVMLLGDERRLTQLFNNLFENTRRYTDAGGRMHVALRQIGDDAELVIEDSAPGVPRELLPRLFERLFRVETSRSRASGGAGLGLSLCRSIVEAHGGNIEASPSELGGLKITIRMPRQN